MKTDNSTPSTVRISDVLSQPVYPATRMFGRLLKFGVVPIIIYYAVNSMAGAAHGMLVINYGLEIIPSKGRAAYYAMVRVIIGITSLLIVNVGALLTRRLEITNFSFNFFGGEITRYHLIFLLGTMMAMLSFIPLLIAGNRKITPVK